MRLFMARCCDANSHIYANDHRQTITVRRHFEERHTLRTSPKPERQFGTKRVLAILKTFQQFYVTFVDLIALNIREEMKPGFKTAQSHMPSKRPRISSIHVSVERVAETEMADLVRRSAIYEVTDNGPNII